MKEYELSIQGVWGVYNRHTLKLLDIEYNIENVALVQLNSETPERILVEYDENSEPYIEYNDSKFYFKDCMLT